MATAEEITRDIVVALIPKISIPNKGDDKAEPYAKFVGELYKGIYNDVLESYNHKSSPRQTFGA